MDTCLNNLFEVTLPGAMFLLSYVPPKMSQSEYHGDDWIGRSHKSDMPGIANYNKATICELAEKHGFVKAAEYYDVLLQDRQEWLLLRRI